jgi:cytoskeletal protein RodZ
MDRWPIDEGTAERLLTGRVAAADAPPGYVDVAALVRSAGAPAHPAELSREADVVAAAVAVISPDSRRAREVPMRRKILPFKVVVAAGIVGALGVASAAAAVSANLTSQGSHHNHHAAAQVSNAVQPTGTSPTSGTNGTNGTGATQTVTGTTAAKGPVMGITKGHAKFGLCTAFLAITKDGTTLTSPALTSVAFKTLMASLGTTSATTAAKCMTVVAKTKPGANPTTHAGAATTDVNATAHQGATSHPNATSHPGPTTHPNATSHPGGNHSS